MNRATKPNIEAAKAAGLREISPLELADCCTVKDVFRAWEEVRTHYSKGYYIINGVILYTEFDVEVNYDDYCMLLFGKPSEVERREWREEFKRNNERIDRERRAFRRRIGDLYLELAVDERHTALIEPDMRQEWCKAVRQVLEGTYRDFCIQAALEIIENLRDGDSFDEIRMKQQDYGHSGGSWSVTVNLVEKFGGVRGRTFAEYSNEQDWRTRK